MLSTGLTASFPEMLWAVPSITCASGVLQILDFTQDSHKNYSIGSRPWKSPDWRIGDGSGSSECRIGSSPCTLVLRYHRSRGRTRCTEQVISSSFRTTSLQRTGTHRRRHSSTSYVDPANERAGPDNEGDHNNDLCGPIEGPPILGEVTLCSKKGMYVTTQFRPMLIHC